MPKPPAAGTARTPRRAGKSRALSPAQLAALPDEELLEQVQRQTFRFFWEGGHPVSGLAADRRSTPNAPIDDLAAVGGTGFGLMSIIVAVERAWITRAGGREPHQCDARCAHPCPVLPRRPVAFPERPHRGDDSVLSQGRCGGPGGDLIPVHGTAVRTAVLRCRHSHRGAAARPCPRAVGRSRMELVHAGSAQAAVLALEPEQRLGDGSGDPRLERVPDHLRAGGGRAALSAWSHWSITAALPGAASS